LVVKDHQHMAGHVTPRAKTHIQTRLSSKRRRARSYSASSPIRFHRDSARRAIGPTGSVQGEGTKEITLCDDVF
jgi:hypothetical protein